jgi:dolichol-phosphate mannosyltransferase
LLQRGRLRRGLTAEVEQVLSAMGRPSEVLLVDDASTDRTLEVMREQQKKYDNVRVLRHTVNCGQSAASATGFRAAHGQIVIVMDGDGQNDPGDIPRLLAALDGADACAACARGVMTAGCAASRRRSATAIAT